MAVTLTIEDARDEFSGPTVAEVPDGWRIIVRRRPDGSDVSVLPAIVAKPAAPAWEPQERAIAVGHFTVERNRLGSTEIRIADTDGDRWRLFLTSDIATGLTGALRGGEPAVFGPGAHEAALARRANAEAEALEMDIAERRRVARANDSRLQCERLFVEAGPQNEAVTIGARRLDDGSELKIDVDPGKILWLVEQLLAAKRRLDREGR